MPYPRVRPELTMADTPESTETPVVAPAPPKRKRNKLVMVLLSLILTPAIIIALWIWVTLGYVYSTGERAGYLQKISRKGWLCKTWEGEIAMTPHRAQRRNISRYRGEVIQSRT